MFRFLIQLFLFIVIPFVSAAQSTLSPQQVLGKTVETLTNLKGVEVGFNLFGSGYSGSGSIKSLNNKFKVSLPEVEVWFNGKELYTLNKNGGETTVVYPTREELAESNPLAYITDAKTNYNVTFSTVRKNGKYVLELLPKKKGGDIKRITLTLNKTNYRPEKIVVEPVSGSPISAEIISFKTGISIPASEFEYPKSKYPKIEIIDLR